ncbi:MAG TPA: heme exporter protein CcmD [Stellaceae bacterium]|nr:heme exporter protein CcmD [Stellaceae bacterium]
MGADLSHWLEMGGYAVYVWSAYAVATIVILAMALASIGRYRTSRRLLAELQAEGEGAHDA